MYSFVYFVIVAGFPENVGTRVLNKLKVKKYAYKAATLLEVYSRCGILLANIFY